MDYVDKFIGQAKLNISRGYYDLPQSNMTDTFRLASLGTKMRNARFGIIAEIKKASPSGDYSLGDIDVAKTARDFKTAGADGISVVVEPEIFKGRIGDITVAKQESGLPVLFKDFIVDKKQIKAAAFYGADCILLISSVLNRLKIDASDFMCFAHAYGLEILMECSSPEEFIGALSTKATMIGINNRNLATLKTSLFTTAGIISQCSPALSSNKKPIISESGINDGKHMEFVFRMGAKGVLVGSALWKSPVPAEKLRELKKAVAHC